MHANTKDRVNDMVDMVLYALGDEKETSDVFIVRVNGEKCKELYRARSPKAVSRQLFAPTPFAPRIFTMSRIRFILVFPVRKANFWAFIFQKGTF